MDIYPEEGTKVIVTEKSIKNEYVIIIPTNTKISLLIRRKLRFVNNQKIFSIYIT